MKHGGSRWQRGLRDFLSWRFTPVLAFAAIWVLGIVGFETTRRDSHLLDSAYRALQTFGLNFDLPAMKGEDISSWLEAGRFLAAAFVVLALIRLFARTFTERIWLSWQCASPERVVLLGFGSVNNAMGRELRRRGVPVTAVDLEFDDADRRLARSHGILLVAGNLSTHDAFRRVRIAEAAAVVVACGKDVANIEIATAATDAIAVSHARGMRSGAPAQAVETLRRFDDADARPAVRGHLSSVRALYDLTEARDLAYVQGGLFQPFSLKIDAARALFDAARLGLRARERGQQRVHLVIVGMGDSGEALFTEGVLNTFAVGLGPPKITFVDRHKDAARERLQTLYPRLFDDSVPAEARPDLSEWIDADATTLRFDDFTRLISVDGGEHKPTAWIFACGEDRTNFNAGLRLELAMHQHVRHPAPIFVRLWGAGIVAEAEQVQRSPLHFTEIFGEIDRAARRAEVLDPRSDELPKLLHQFYRDADKAAETQRLARRGGTAGKARDAFNAEWRRLPENARDSNRRAARHAAVKLIDLGLQWRGMDKGVLPALAEKFVERIEKAAKALTFDDGDLGLPPDTDGGRLMQAAFVEHARWMVDRALSGWRAGPPSQDGEGVVAYRRDNRRRWHDNIRPFKEVPPAIRSYDVTLIRALLSFLSGESEEGRPPAFERKALECALSRRDATPSPDTVGQDVTELVFVVGDAPVTPAVEAAAATLVEGWAKRPNAVRVQIRAERPLSAPLVGSFASPDAAVARLVRRLHEAAGPEILFDITPLHGADPQGR